MYVFAGNIITGALPLTFHGARCSIAPPGQTATHQDCNDLQSPSVYINTARLFPQATKSQGGTRNKAVMTSTRGSHMKYTRFGAPFCQEDTHGAANLATVIPLMWMERSVNWYDPHHQRRRLYLACRSLDCHVRGPEILTVLDHWDGVLTMADQIYDIEDENHRQPSTVQGSGWRRAKNVEQWPH